MKILAAVMNWVFGIIIRILCRVETDELIKVPQHGPLILVANHVNFLELPVMVTYLLPRPLAGFAKAENWRMPFFRQLFSIWEAIPLERGQIDRKAFHKALEQIDQGRIFAVAPEGTRSGDGRLLPGKPGIVILAVQSRAPLLPLVYYGGEKFWENLRRFRRTDFHIRVGDPFCIRIDDGGLTKEIRQEISDEIMYKLAELLPVQYRGYYSGPIPTEYRFLQKL